MSSLPKQEERRQFVRIKKHYIIRFYQKNNPALKYETSQIENISKGGVCFTSTFLFDKGDILCMELRTPYIADTLYLEGVVLNVQEKIKGLIYQNHFQFQNINPVNAGILEKIEKYNISKDGAS